MPAPLSLPIVDISSFLPSTSTSSHPAPSSSTRDSVASTIHSACVNQGFFYLQGFSSLLSSSELDYALSIAHQFFERPMEEKKSLRIKKGDGARGYQLLGENVTQYKADWHEALDLYAPVEKPEPEKLLHGENQWPIEPPEFRTFLEEVWIPKMKILGMALMEATALGLGITPSSTEWRSLLSLVHSSFWVMRIIGYPPLPTDAPGVSCGQHVDYGCWTLLHASPTKGALQVFLRDENGSEVQEGDKGDWVDADPVQRDGDGVGVVVNIGAMWETWTNGLYKATLHRVVHKGSEYRVSLPFFFEPNFDAVISPLPSALALQASLNGGKETEKKKSVVYGEYLRGKVEGNFKLED